MRQFRKLGKGKPAAIAGVAAAVTLLTGCAQPAATGWQTSAPAAGSYGAASAGSRQIGSPAADGDASSNGSGVVGAGSFPRSFLIPGTDTSIRIGG